MGKERVLQRKSESRAFLYSQWLNYKGGWANFGFDHYMVRACAFVSWNVYIYPGSIE